MTLTDIDLANLDTKPFFRTQVRNLLEILLLTHPKVSVYLFTQGPGADFTLQNLPSNQNEVFNLISAEIPVLTQVITEGIAKSLFFSNLENAAIFSKDPSAWAPDSILAPIGEDGELAGFLLGILPHGMQPGQVNLPLFDLLAQAIGTNSVMSNLVEGYKQRADRLSVMLEVNSHLNIAATKTDFLYEISRFGKYFLNFDRAVLVLHPEETPEYFTIDSIEGAETGLQVGMSYPLYNSLVSRTILTGQYFVYKASHTAQINGIYRANDHEEYGYAQVIAFPLEKVKNAPGALVLESVAEYPIKQSETSIFEMISQSLGAALTRFSLYERLNNYATIDTLTHLYNLRALKQRFGEELARAARYQNSLVILFLDLDKFKRVNDTYGHLMGDFVLRETSQIIRDSIRTSDIPGRYGGEEFVVIMVNADADACLASAQRICTAIHDHHYEMNETTVETKISIGLSEFPRDGESMQDLIQSADAAMYTAKRRGGDQVVKYEKGMVTKSKA